MAERSQRDRMEAGLWYDANFDEALVAERARAMDLADELNRTPYGQPARRDELLRQLLGSVGANVEVLSPLMVDYGRNVSIGDGTFVNHGAYLMDGAPVRIGARCFIGPDFGAYTAQHPLVVEQRNRGLERALPVTVGDDCWIGARVSVMPGVSIGAGCVIGAGSIVTKDVPAGWLAMGVPCRRVRPVTDADRVDEG